jgi:phage protein U
MPIPLTTAAGQAGQAPLQNSVSRNLTLMQWSALQFEVYPLNIHEVDHLTQTDWARKEIAGAPIYREWVGENDEEIHLRGRIFPYRIGGLTELQVIEAMRRQGIAGLMVRGDGIVLGWFVCERLVRQHQHLGIAGVGQQVNFVAVFARVPVPSGEDEFPVLWGTVL